MAVLVRWQPTTAMAVKFGVRFGNYDGRPWYLRMSLSTSASSRPLQTVEIYLRHAFHTATVPGSVSQFTSQCAQTTTTTTTKTTIYTLYYQLRQLWPVTGPYTSRTVLSKNRRIYWSKILLPAFTCWRQLANSALIREKMLEISSMVLPTICTINNNKNNNHHNNNNSNNNNK